MAAHDRGRSGQFIRSEQQAETDTRAVRLRAQGMSFSAIGKALGYADESGARKAVARALAAVPAADVEEFRALQGEALDQVERECWRIIAGTHYRVSNSGRVVAHPVTGETLTDPAPVLSALNTLLKVSARRAALYGLDAPKALRVENTPVDLLGAYDTAIAQLNAQIAAEDRQGPPPGHPG